MNKEYDEIIYIKYNIVEEKSIEYIQVLHYKINSVFANDKKKIDRLVDNAFNNYEWDRYPLDEKWCEQIKIKIFQEI